MLINGSQCVQLCEKENLFAWNHNPFVWINGQSEDPSTTNQNPQKFNDDYHYLLLFEHILIWINRLWYFSSPNRFKFDYITFKAYQLLCRQKWKAAYCPEFIYYRFTWLNFRFADENAHKKKLINVVFICLLSDTLIIKCTSSFPEIFQMKFRRRSILRQIINWSNELAKLNSLESNFELIDYRTDKKKKKT